MCSLHIPIKLKKACIYNIEPKEYRGRWID